MTTPPDLPSVKSDSISPLPLSFCSRGSAAEPSRNGLAPGWLIGCVGGHAGISVRIPCKIKYYPPTKPRQFAGRRPTPISRWRDPGFLSAPQMDASTVQCSFARAMLLRLYTCFPGQTGGGALNPRIVRRQVSNVEQETTAGRTLEMGGPLQTTRCNSNRRAGRAAFNRSGMPSFALRPL